MTLSNRLDGVETVVDRNSRECSREGKKGKQMAATQNQPSIKILKESAARFGFENMAGGSVKAAFDSLQTFFDENFGGRYALAKCPKCNLYSPEKDKAGNEITSCPGCGAKFTADAPVEEPKGGKGGDGTVPKIAKKKGADKEPKEEYIATAEQKAELSEHVSKIEELRGNVAANTHDLGVELNVINDKALWRGLGYSSFYEYAAKELEFSRASAYKYMMIAREFNKEDFLTIGVKKGELIASAPERHQKKLKAAAMKGKSFTELKGQLNKLEGRTGGGSGKASERVTLLGHVKKNENLEMPWLSGTSHEPVTSKGVKNRYMKIKLTDEVELVLIPNETDLGVIASFRKIGEETKPEEPETDAGEANGTEPAATETSAA